MHLNENDVATRLDLSPKTLQNWRVLGKGPVFYKLGSRVVYNETDVEEWLEGQRRNSTSQSIASQNTRSRPAVRARRGK